MGWMNDTLKYVGIDPVFRKWHHNLMNFSLMYIFKENFILPLSHDEVVHGKKAMIDKMFGDYDSKFRALRLYYLFMLTHPGKKLSFMGNEFAPFLEWRFYEELEWKMLDFPIHASMKDYVKALNAFYLSNKALWEVDDDYSGFRWINADDADYSILSYVRYSKDEHDHLVVVCNFTPVEHSDFIVGVPDDAEYHKVFASNGDDGVSANCKVINEGRNDMPFSIKIKLPGYSAVVYKPVFRS
jgi:1,4-alpha-glucan branching enzyme